MKKKFALFMSTMMIIGMLAGCGKAAGEDVSKYITLGEYKGLEVTVAEIPVEEADVEAYVLQLYQQSITPENGGVTERPVETGDTVNIDYVGKKDGVAFEGGTDSGYNLVIGSGNFIPGFEDGLIGVNPGETVDLDLTFPEAYHSAELAGKAVVFTVTVNYIVPLAEDMTDEVVAGFGNEQYTNLAEMKEYANTMIAESNQQQYETNVQNAVFGAVMSNVVVKEMPEDEVIALQARLIKNYSPYAQSYGLDVDTFMQYAFGADVETLAEDNVVQNLVGKAIAREEGLEVTDEEVAAEMQAEMDTYGITKEELLGAGTEEDYKNSVRMKKVLNFLIENTTIKSE